MRFVFFVFFFLLSLPLHAADLPVPVTQALREAVIPQDAVAVFAQRVDQSQPLIVHHAAEPMSPASTMKLLTTYAALEQLGPAYMWKTEIYADGPMRDGVLDGNLVIKGYGDPALTLPGFWEMLRGLRKTGLRDIKGDVVLDSSYFDAIPRDTGTFDGEPWRAYNAAPDALMVNFKATEFEFRPGNGSVAIIADPDLPQLKIVNHVEPHQGACGNWKGDLHYEVAQQGGQVSVSFAGKYALACGAKNMSLALVDGPDYVFQLFRQLWREQGGTVAGTLKQGQAGAGAQLLLQGDSVPLAEAVRMINKNSNNVMARELLLTLGAEKSGAPATVEKGTDAVRQWLAAKGLDFPELVIENGAGLSRIERISARHLGELLLAAWRSPVMPELVASLPIAAVDGTMEHRLKDTAAAGEAHIKTGSLDGVKSMAGYVLDRHGRRWVVVCIVNHAHAAEARPAMDALLEWLRAR